MARRDQQDVLQRHTAAQGVVLRDLGQLQHTLARVQSMAIKQRQGHDDALARAQKESAATLRQRDAEIERLQALLTARDGEVAALQRALAEHAERHRKAVRYEQRDRRRHGQVIDDLWRALELANGHTTQLVAQRDSLAEHAELLQTELDNRAQPGASDPAALHALQDELAAATQRYDASAVRVRELEAQMNTHQETAAARLLILRGKIAQLEGASPLWWPRLAQVSAAENAAGQAVLEQRLQALQATLDERTVTLQRAEAELSSTRAELAQAAHAGASADSACAAQLQAELAAAVTRHAEAVAALARDEHERVGLQRQFDEYRERTDAAIATLQDNLAKAEAEVEDLDGLVEHVRSVLVSDPSPATLAQLVWELDTAPEDAEA